MSNPVYFTVAADFRAFIEDASSDSDYDPQIVPVGGTVTFTPLVNAGDVVLATQTSPRPIGFIPSPVTAIIDPADGRLKLRKTADSGASGSLGFAPVRLLADSAVLELDSPLFYSVSFSEVVFSNNRRGSITGFTFQAPNTDTEINLITVGRQPGQPASGITKIAPGAVRLASNGTDIIFSFAGVDLDEPVSLAGVTGPTGATGAAATIAVGTVQTGSPGSSATVTNSGSSGAAVFNFTIPRGDVGATGPQGPMGAQGIQGQPGVSLDIQGTVANYASLPASPAAGDAYLVADQGKLYYFDGASWPADGSGVAFVGPQGPTGAQGIQGPVGASGGTGGVGATGEAATITVGTVQTGAPGSSVQVVNSGSSGAAILDFTIPRGDVGATGPEGPMGPTGPTGPTGASGGTGGTGGVGATGASGVPGASGASGPAGPSVVADNLFTLQDDLDATKQAQFQVSSVGTGSTAVFTLPGASTTLVGTDSTQSLSNKTLASPAVTGTARVAQSGEISLFNTADQTTNYERGLIRWNSNVFEIGSQNAGTGSARVMRVGDLVNGRYFEMRAGVPFLNMYAAATGATGNLFAVMNGGSVTSSSGTQVLFAVVPTINQSSTASYTALLVNPTETATGSGTKLLADFQVGGVSKAKIDNTGLLTANNLVSSSASTVTAAGTTTLTVNDSQVQVFTGTSNQTVKLPTTGVVAGQTYTIVNQSTGSIAVQSSNGTNITSIYGASKAYAFIAAVNTPTTWSDWNTLSLFGSYGNASYSTALRDGNGNLLAGSFIPSVTSTATAAGTTSLTNSSFEFQLFTGTSTQTCVLPTTSVPIGRRFTIINNSTGAVTVNASGGATVLTLPGGTSAVFVALQATPTTAAHWSTMTVPVANITASTTAALGVGSIELGHASDTTLTRSAAGELSVEGVPVVTTTGVQSLSGKTLASPAVTGTASVAQGGEVHLFGTSDQTTNFSRLALRVSNSVFEIAPQWGGTGTPRTVRIGSSISGTASVARYVGINATVTPLIDVNIGSTTLSGNLSQTSGTVTSSSAAQVVSAITPTINQSSTAGYTALLINPTETATGSGTKRLFDAQVGGSSRFNVDNSGNVFVNGTLDLGNASDTTLSRSAAGELSVEGVPVVTTSSTDTLTNKTLTAPKITSGSAPAAANSTGTAGTIVWDTDYVYICTATDTWKRAAISTWP